ncbi:MAG: hypothetical protein Fur005_39520 [Roseiflexaceae bacterium]
MDINNQGRFVEFGLEPRILAGQAGKFGGHGIDGLGLWARSLGRQVSLSPFDAFAPSGDLGGIQAVAA